MVTDAVYLCVSGSNFPVNFAGAKSKHLVSSTGKLAEPSSKALELFEKRSMAEVRSALDK